MKILAIDIGTHLGWAFGPDLCGVEDFSVKRHESKGMRYIHFRNWLHKVAQKENVDLLSYEEVQFFRGADANLVYGGLLGQLQAFCAEQGIEHVGVSVSALKKHATGKGNSGKPQMIAAAQAKFGEEHTDENVCDALWLWDYSQQEWGK